MHRNLLFFGGLHAFNEHIFAQSLKPHNAHFNGHKRTTLMKNVHDAGIDETDPSKPRRRFHYTAISYALSSKAAQVLVDLVDRKGFKVAADMMLIKLMDLIEGLTFPFLSGSI